MAKPILLNLTPEDRSILDRLAKEVGASKSDVLRWSLRFYALKGPWTDAPLIDRPKVTAKAGDLVVGPLRMEVNS